MCRESENAAPEELYWIDPTKVKPVPAFNQPIGYYEYRPGDGRIIKIPASEIIHFMLPDPTNRRWGQSMLQAGAYVVDADREAQRFQVNFLKKSAVPVGVFSFAKGTKSRHIKKAKKKLLAEYFGAMNGGKPLFLGHEATFQPMAATAKDMRLMEFRKLGAHEICAVLLTPGPIVGLEQPTFNNMETSERIWWEHLLIPVMKGIGRTFNIRLVQQFEDSRRYRIYPVTSHVESLLPHTERRFDFVKKLTSEGVPYNRAIEEAGTTLSPIEGGDIGFHSASGTWLEPPGDEVEASNTDVQAQALNGAQVTALAGMLEKISAGLISPDAAVVALQVAFPTIDQDEAQQMVAAQAAIVSASDDVSADVRSKCRSWLNNYRRRNLPPEARAVAEMDEAFDNLRNALASR